MMKFIPSDMMTEKTHNALDQAENRTEYLKAEAEGISTLNWWCQQALIKQDRLCPVCGKPIRTGDNSRLFPRRKDKTKEPSLENTELTHGGCQKKASTIDFASVETREKIEADKEAKLHEELKAKKLEAEKQSILDRNLELVRTWQQGKCWVCGGPLIGNGKAVCKDRRAKPSLHNTAIVHATCVNQKPNPTKTNRLERKKAARERLDYKNQMTLWKRGAHRKQRKKCVVCNERLLLSEAIFRPKDDNNPLSAINIELLHESCDYPLEWMKG